MPEAQAPLSPDEELRAYARLKDRLAPMWAELFPRDDLPYTSVIVPSEPACAPADWSTYREERLLFLLIRLRNPRARLVYVTSQPVHPLVVEYYLQLLVGVPAAHARARLTLLCAYDHSPRALTEKVLERPRLVERIRRAIPDPRRAYLTVCEPTPLERRLAVRLEIPMNGLDPQLAGLRTPAGAAQVFQQAGVPWSAGPPEAADAQPSVELRINPLGVTRVSSTHEHRGPVRGDERSGATCLFPAEESYRRELQALGLRVGAVLAGLGVTARCSVAFLARPRQAGWELQATSLRFGVVEATHPMLALRLLTGGGLDPHSGAFVAQHGKLKHYEASDDVRSQSYRGLLPDDLVEILTAHHLSFDPRTETGVLFHMLGAVSQFGRLGLVAIGDSRSHAERLFGATLDTLDRETR